MKFRNRVTEMLGVELPIVQAPMGWIARSQLASAVSNAGGMGIIEFLTSSILRRYAPCVQNGLRAWKK